MNSWRQRGPATISVRPVAIFASGFAPWAARRTILMTQHCNLNLE